jgi:hypothetical protein
MAVIAALAVALASGARLTPTRQIGLAAPAAGSPSATKEEIQLGVDENGDGVLEDDEVEETAYIDVAPPATPSAPGVTK